MTHNRLTVDTMAPTQMEPSHERRGYAAQEGEEYFDRLDSKRYKSLVHSSCTYSQCVCVCVLLRILCGVIHTFWNVQVASESMNIGSSLTQESLPYTF